MADSLENLGITDTVPGTAASQPRPALPAGPVLAAVAGAAIAGVGLAAYMTYAARRGADEIMHPCPSQPFETPESHGLAAEAVRIESEDGPTLGAWYVPAVQETTRAIAMFHGHSAARSQLLPYARFLREDYHCLLVDFRACGDSEGSASSLSVHEARDVLAAVRWLKARGMDRIGVWGMSMGGAAAIRAAAESLDIAAVVAEGTFDRVEHVIAKRARDRRYPFPRLLAKAIVKEVGRRLGFPDPLPQPVDLIGRLSPRPVLLIHGSTDETSPVENAYRLYKAAGYPKALYVVPDAGHTLCRECDAHEYERRVMDFFGRAL